MFKVTFRTHNGFFGEEGFAWTYTGNHDVQVHIREWIISLYEKVPALRWLVRRVLRHELDHLRYEDFKKPSDHHIHYCGRNTRWYTLFSTKHLVSTNHEADLLARNGEVSVDYEEGSQIHDYLEANK